MRRLTLIRHGLTEGNVRRWYYGALDLPLCETGKSALREAAAGGLYPPYSGADLREVRFGIFEGKSYNELKGQPDYEAWLAGDWFRNVPPGGESFAQAETRILSALNRMQAQNADILAVVHGGTVLTIMQALFPEEEKSGYDWQPRPGGGYQIDLAAHTYRRIGIQA